MVLFRIRELMKTNSYLQSLEDEGKVPKGTVTKLKIIQDEDIVFIDRVDLPSSMFYGK